MNRAKRDELFQKRERLKAQREQAAVLAAHLRTAERELELAQDLLSSVLECLSVRSASIEVIELGPPGPIDAALTAVMEQRGTSSRRGRVLWDASSRKMLAAEADRAMKSVTTGRVYVCTGGRFEGPFVCICAVPAFAIASSVVRLIEQHAVIVAIDTLESGIDLYLQPWQTDHYLDWTAWGRFADFGSTWASDCGDQGWVLNSSGDWIRQENYQPE